MSKRYYSLFWDARQLKCLICRIYLNIFGIFLGIKLLPLGFDRKMFEFWYNGDTVFWLFPWYKKNIKARWVSTNFSGNGEFGDAMFSSLAEMDREWQRFEEITCNQEQPEILLEK